jgi:hypothetical protein
MPPLAETSVTGIVYAIDCLLHILMTKIKSQPVIANKPEGREWIALTGLRPPFPS